VLVVSFVETVLEVGYRPLVLVQVPVLVVATSFVGTGLGVE
jgi:hypothetical protein